MGSRGRLLDLISLAGTAAAFLIIASNRLGGTDWPVRSAACDSTAPQLKMGVFQGASPLELAPLELLQPAVEAAGAWPAANPVLTLGAGDEGSGRGVAAPFLYPTEDRLFAFYEEAWCAGSGRGYIAAAESADGGLTWQPQGPVLDERWHLSSPFVFQHGDQVYMVPSSPAVHEVNLYRTTRFPGAWQYVQTLLREPLAAVSLAQHNGSWWMFGSRRGAGAEGSGGVQEVYTAASPRGPWQPHSSAPLAAEMFSRVLEQDGRLLRLGRPCDGGLCGGATAFEVSLTEGRYRQRELQPAPLLHHSRQPAAWDGDGHSHVDLVQLPDGRWLAAATGSSAHAQPQLSQAAVALQLLSLLLQVFAICTLLTLLLVGSIRLAAAQRPLGRSAWGRQVLAHVRPAGLPGSSLVCGPMADAPMAFISITPRVSGGGKRADSKQPLPWAWELEARQRRRAGARPAKWRTAALVAGVAALFGSALVARVVQHALDPFLQPIQQLAGSDGRYSKFTLMVMSYDRRLESLKAYVSHYSQCPSVGEILVVWNKGVPPEPERDLPSLVPVRVRVEANNSMNNRYKPDPGIKYRAVLSLDDDIMMPCADVELGFARWRQRPDQIVGYYPRLITEAADGRLEYNWEDTTVQKGEYNALLTGAAFIDSWTAFPLYWADSVAPARQLVDRLVNCDDLLMVWVWHNATAAARGGFISGSGGGTAAGSAVELEAEAGFEFVRAQRRVDVSYLSGVGLSHDHTKFQQQAEQCLAEFVHIFGGNPMRSRRFDWSSYKPPPVCSLTGKAFGCLYL